MTAGPIAQTPLLPSYVGYIGSTKDALVVIQAVLNHQLPAVPRRPHEKERSDLIQSGSVFVFVEEKSGIKRWTDGVSWSPSRILGRFLVYRELDRQGLSSIRSTQAARVPGTSMDKKLAKKMKRKSATDISTPSNDTLGNLTPSRGQSLDSGMFSDPKKLTHMKDGSQQEQSSKLPGASNTLADRSLVGSLIASYAFKEYGLIKKTMSITVPKMDHSGTSSNSLETIHLVSYYKAEDVLNGSLVRPGTSLELKDIELSKELWDAVKECSLGGKIPLEDEAIYMMHSSNPNAVALGFNPAIHMQPQYQNNNDMVMPQETSSSSFNQLPLKSLRPETFPRATNLTQDNNSQITSQPQYPLHHHTQQRNNVRYLQPTLQHLQQGETTQFPQNFFAPQFAHSQLSQAPLPSHFPQQPTRNNNQYVIQDQSVQSNNSEQLGPTEQFIENSGVQYPFASGGATPKFNTSLSNFVTYGNAQPPQLQGHSFPSTSAKLETPTSPNMKKESKSPIISEVSPSNYNPNQFSIHAATPRDNMALPVSVPASLNHSMNSMPPHGAGSFTNPHGPGAYPGNMPQPHNPVHPTFNTTFNNSNAQSNMISSESTSGGHQMYSQSPVHHQSGPVMVGQGGYPVIYGSASSGAGAVNGRLFYDENGQIGNFVGNLGQYPHYTAGPPN